MLRQSLAAFALIVVTLAGSGTPIHAADPEPAATASPTPAPSPPFNTLGWRSAGPAISGGRVTAVAGSPRDPFLYYLGSAGGGIWKTTNGGATWKPIFDKVGISSIGALAVDPHDDRIVWAGTGETNPRNDVSHGAGLYKSTDGGATWAYMGLRETSQISSIALDSRDPRHVLVGAMGDFFRDTPDRGVYRTDDGGKTWRKTLFIGPQSGVSDLAADPTDPAIVYAGMWQFQRRPWTFTSGGPADGIFKSVDGGTTWSRLAEHGLPAGMTGRIGLAVAPSNARRVYALIESKSGILWRSDDAGSTWKRVSSNTLVDQRPFYFTHLAVDPTNADHVYGISEMLSESKDGGTTFEAIAKDVHVDYHSMWIAPNDPKRMIVGEDGGYAVTVDGKNWSDNENLPIGQIYHVGYDDETPYRLCASLQDNNAFCGPSNSRDPNGTANRDWERVVGGDGMWAWPDPTDAQSVWTDLQDGNVSIYDRVARRNTFVQPWLGTAGDAFAIAQARYRFNWDSPIAFAPWDPHTVWYGGDVVFQTQDRGASWKAISPDLTRNVKAHQQPSGGPLAFDVSGAEYTDTILDIEGSTVTRDEIWVGTDDGRVQLTRDDGAHWNDVTPAGIAPDGRFEIVAPSPLRAGTAYATYDRHYLGDRSPYVFVTHDYGATWRSIARGLTADAEARSIRPDTVVDGMVYLGTESGVMLSTDDGAHWQRFNLNMPAVPVYDLRIQPRYDDLIAATHGRSLYVFDDLRPVQELARAKAAGVMLFAPHPAYEYGLHDDEESPYTAYYAKNPPSGAAIAFYQAAPAAKPPEIRILDGGGRLVRTIGGQRCVERKAEPFVSNNAGLNRVIWDLRGDGPVRWNGAAREAYKGPRTGPLVVPGRYTVEITLAGKTLRRDVDVLRDPRLSTPASDDVAGNAFVRAQLAKYSAVDTALNRLDAVAAAATADALPALAERAQAVRGELTADYHNDEDSIGRPGKVREDLAALTGFRAGSGAPSAATRDLAARVDAEEQSALADVDALFAGDVATADAKLRAAHRPPLAESQPVPPLDCASDE